MAQVTTWTNLDLPDLAQFMKSIIADSTGRQEALIVSTVNKLDAFKFGIYETGIFVQIGYVGTADTYRTSKVLQFIVQKLYQKYNVNKLSIYVTYNEVSRTDISINGQLM
ncbi:Macrophage_migration inhibitory factor family protein [Hexamita inflata]|uniref:Macrophage migration inhibitory factor family protein n=1 Tax=Hexamita inflata TaxID=28002 RepID=A0AA86NKD3_9EUKA|nr:Macrophage migration inhibitory factor family protein [Hexamita inflata]CAI9950199.1 Macrophage migration inhibitory factor family protein [Hexamita inflata]CAI9951507.1 Macrophage migration inhibitory factor family protein [Hexamita inflata]